MINKEIILEKNNDLVNIKSLDEIKENQFKIIYSDKFKNSKYNLECIKIKNVLDIDFYNLFVKEIIKNEIDEKKYFQLNNNLYLIEKVNILSNHIFTIFNSYINRKIIEELENNLNLEKYSLFVKNIFFLNLNENYKSDYSNNIINCKNNYYEFLLLINISDTNNLNIKLADSEFILESCTALFFSNKLNFDILNKSNYLIILNISYYNGYNRYEYNKHPNEVFFN